MDKDEIDQELESEMEYMTMELRFLLRKVYLKGKLAAIKDLREDKNVTRES